MPKYKVNMILTTPDPAHPLNGSVLEGTMETIKEVIEIKKGKEVKGDIRHQWNDLVIQFIEGGTMDGNRPGLHILDSMPPKEYSTKWAVPLNKIHETVWKRGGYNYVELERRKYRYESARAVGYAIVFAFRLLKKNEMSMDATSLLSVQKTAISLATTTDYLEKATNKSILNGWQTGLVKVETE